MILYVVVLISSTLGKESPRGCISCSVCRSHSKRISDPHFLIALGTHPHQSTLSLSLFPSSLFSLRLKINFLGRPSTLPPLVFALLFLDHRLRPQIKATGRSRIPRIQGRNVDRWRIPCCSKGVTIRIISNSNVPLSAIYL